MMNNKEKAQLVKSNWWRWPFEALFPDKKFDGQLQNPGSEEIFDFDDVIAETSPITTINQEIVYYPENDRGELFAIFIPGLGQVAKESSRRSRRYAVTLKTGVANLNNSSFIRTNPISRFMNSLLDWIDAAIHRIGLSGSPAINNTTSLILSAIENETPVNFSGDSHGTILLARAIYRAKRKFIGQYGKFWNLKQRQIGSAKWERVTSEVINIFAFGNGYKNWAKGPKYIMVSIEGDVVPNTLGLTPQKAVKYKRDDITFLIFPRIFPQGSFEAHNMMFTTELLRHTFLKNNMEIGDFNTLYEKLKNKTLKLATPDEVPWPSDMKDYVWNEESLNSIQIASD